MKLMVRDCDILAWLLHMKFSHLDQIGRKFFPGCNIHRAPYRRMLKLMDAGLVATRKVYSNPRDLYIPTQAVIKVLEDSGNPFAIALAKDKTFPNYFHDRGLIDMRILFEELGIGLWIPERVIRSVKPRGGSPDALILNVDQVYAVEYERTEKEPARYKKIFDRFNYSDKFAKVLYILPTEKRIESLKKKMGYIWQKFCFVSEECLHLEKMDAVFRSSQGELPIRALAEYSMTGGLHDMTREEIREVVESKTPGAWQNSKLSAPYGGGGDSCDDDSDFDDDPDPDSDDDPQKDPGENRDGDDDDEEDKGR